MTAERTAGAAGRPTDEEERQMLALRRLLAARGIERFGVFSDIGEGTRLPDGTEDVSGYVVDDRGRVFFFWTGWDAARGEVALETWHEIAPKPGWEQSAEYRAARRAAGLVVEDQP